MGGSKAETIRQPRDRLKRQPQERQHSAANGGTRDRLPPARGAVCQCANAVSVSVLRWMFDRAVLYPGGLSRLRTFRWRQTSALGCIAGEQATAA